VTLDEGVDRIAIERNRCHAHFAVSIVQSERLLDRASAALRGFAEGGIGVIDGERDVAHAIAMQLDVIGDGMIGTKRSGEDEADFPLLQHVAGAIADAGFRSAVAGERHAERRSIIVRGLAGVADVELDVIGSVERKKIRFDFDLRFLRG